MIERYTRKDFGKIWSLENKFQKWLDVELAVCEAWHRLRVIPDKEMQEIREKASFDVDRILQIEEITKHDVIAFLTCVEEKVGPASRFIHLGCTSSDIVDTANSLLLKEAGEIILKDIDMIMDVLKRMCFKYKGLVVIGRTHGVHAEPTSFGLKLATFYEEFKRQRTRWLKALDEISVGKISGAVGTYAHLLPEVERIACEILNLKVDPISTQIIQRDRYAFYFSVLANIGGTIERLALELRHLQRTEVLEVEEGFTKGQKGSSAMPHKKNPISAENLCGLARVVRTNSIAALENMALWHERDISHSSVERIIMPDSTILIDYMLNRLTKVLENLKINRDNMERNLNLSFGLFFSQRILLALIDKGLKRQQAYEMIQKQALRAWEEKRHLYDLVIQDKDITTYLTKDEIDNLFDVNYYLRFEDEIYNRVFN